MTNSPPSRTAFVTGAAGFLGRHLVERLHQHGWAVTACCLPVDDPGPLLQLAQVVTADVTDLATLRAAMPPAPHAVFHLAADTGTWARNAARQHRTNVLGTANVVTVALERKAARFVYTSSISAYGYQPGRLIDENTPSNAPTHGDNYGRTKLLAEQHIQTAVAEQGLPAVILNPVNLLGRYDRDNWTRQLILPAARGQLRAVPPGSATWAAAADVADAHVSAAERGSIGANYLLGGVPASFLAVVNTVEDLVGQPRTRRAAPRAALRAAWWAASLQAKLTGRAPALTRPQYRRAVGDLRCDDARARQDLGYQHTALATVLTDTIDWLRHQGLLAPAVPGGPSLAGEASVPSGPGTAAHPGDGVVSP